MLLIGLGLVACQPQAGPVELNFDPGTSRLAESAQKRIADLDPDGEFNLVITAKDDEQGEQRKVVLLRRLKTHGIAEADLDITIETSGYDKATITPR